MIFGDDDAARIAATVLQVEAAPRNDPPDRPLTIGTGRDVQFVRIVSVGSANDPDYDAVIVEFDSDAGAWNDVESGECHLHVSKLGDQVAGMRWGDDPDDGRPVFVSFITQSCERTLNRVGIVNGQDNQWLGPGLKRFDAIDVVHTLGGAFQAPASGMIEFSDYTVSTGINVPEGYVGMYSLDTTAASRFMRMVGLTNTGGMTSVGADYGYIELLSSIGTSTLDGVFPGIMLGQVSTGAIIARKYGLTGRWQDANGLKITLLEVVSGLVTRIDLTLGSGGSGTGPASGGSGGSGSISGIGQGHTNWMGATGSLLGVSGSAGDVLVVNVAATYTPNSVKFNGTDLSLAAGLATYNELGKGYVLSVWFLKLSAGASGTVTVEGFFANDLTAMNAVMITGLAHGTVKGSSINTGTNNNPDSGHTAMDANNYANCAIMTAEDLTNPNGTWLNGFTDGGQDDAAIGGADKVRIDEGFLITTASATTGGAKIGTLAAVWAATTVVFQ
jgi:hypothetical protein